MVTAVPPAGWNGSAKNLLTSYQDIGNSRQWRTRTNWYEVQLTTPNMNPRTDVFRGFGNRRDLPKTVSFVSCLTTSGVVKIRRLTKRMACMDCDASRSVSSKPNVENELELFLGL